MTTRPDNINHLLSSTRKHIETLLTGIPRLCDFLPVSGDDCPRTEFKLLELIPMQLVEVEGRSVVAIAFCGPSGAGKSSVFNLLTNLSVPAGGAVRPMTHASLVAIPQAIANDISLEKLFPGFCVAELGNSTDLRNAATPVDRLFRTSYQNITASKDLWACLIDVPDFNTTELANWAKAEQMIRRADSTIFTVYHEAYKSQKTFEMLKRVLHLSGSMTWLLTKLDSENCAHNAREIREDLINCASQDPDFQLRRADGQTLLEFLQKSPFYFSPYTQKVGLKDIQPLANTVEDFSSHIFGQKGLEILLERQLQSISLGVAACNNLCSEAQLELEKTGVEISRIEKHLAKASEHITGEEFPVFLILAKIRTMLEENRPSILKRAFVPFLMLGSGLKSIISSVGNSIAKLSNKDLGNTIMSRNDLERSRLQSEVDKLIEFWRRTPEFSHISSEACRAASDCVLNTALPAVDSEWETTVNESLVKWQANNKNLWVLFSRINDFCLLLGGGLVVADIFIGGGIGTLGVVAAIGGSSAAGAGLSALFTNMGLGNEIIEAHRNWKRLRRKAYEKHLQELLAGPLFLNNLLKTSKGLSPELLNTCKDACRELKEISRTK